MMIEEIKDHLLRDIIPFWRSMRDNDYGGYYGYVDFDRNIMKKAEKGCILNSRITWFFSNAYRLLGDKALLDEARHGFEFLKNYCQDKENGGVYWSVSYDGTPEDTTKHTYNQAFCIYALSSFYDVSKDRESLRLAEELYNIIEEKCRDSIGYLEAFDRWFQPVENDKLSENGVMAERTMNTLLHVFEAYTEFYRITGRPDVKERMEWILDIIAEKVYNPNLHRQEVFFDKNYNSILDICSYGHDIEAAWLLDRGLEILGDKAYMEKISPITRDLTGKVFEDAFDGHSLSNECERGIVDTNRVWWVQAEGIVGFLNGYEKDSTKAEYLNASGQIWEFIKAHVIDKRPGSEWFWLVDKDGAPYTDKPIVEPWKCPYHNGRMCFEVIRRKIDVT